VELGVLGVEQALLLISKICPAGVNAVIVFCNVGGMGIKRRTDLEIKHVAECAEESEKQDGDGEELVDALGLGHTFGRQVGQEVEVGVVVVGRVGGGREEDGRLIGAAGLLRHHGRSRVVVAGVDGGHEGRGVEVFCVRRALWLVGNRFFLPCRR